MAAPVGADRRQYPCDIAGCCKGFAVIGDLVAHAHTHYWDTMKPYACDFEGCGKAFVGAGGLVKHKRTHQ